MVAIVSCLLARVEYITASALNRYRLGVSRLPQLECCGDERENFYQQRLFTGLAWYCDEKPTLGEDAEGNAISIWTLKWFQPRPEKINGVVLPEEKLTLTNEGKTTTVSFELACKHFETMMADVEMDLLCPCCAQTVKESPCPACRFAMGFHYCQNEYSNRRGFMQWPQGCLHNLKVDGQRVIWNLHRRNLPLDVIDKKIQTYTEEGLIENGEAERMFKCIQSERGEAPIENDMGSDGGEGVNGRLGSRKLTQAQMETMLERRIQLMKEGAPDGAETDQYRVFRFIVEGLQSDTPLRLMVQASAGTGKSLTLSCSKPLVHSICALGNPSCLRSTRGFLLTTVFLWCLVNKKKAKAAAPTGNTNT